MNEKYKNDLNDAKKIELRVIDYLKKRGYIIFDMRDDEDARKHDYDIIVDGVKVEIKSSYALYERTLRDKREGTHQRGYGTMPVEYTIDDNGLVIDGWARFTAADTIIYVDRYTDYCYVVDKNTLLAFCDDEWSIIGADDMNKPAYDGEGRRTFCKYPRIWAMKHTGKNRPIIDEFCLGDINNERKIRIRKYAI